MIVKQIRYYPEDESNITAEELIAGTALDVLCDEIQIKTVPGAIININGTTIYVGIAGNYNLLKKEGYQVSSIQVFEGTIELIKNTKSYFIATFIQSEE